ncbi:MAG: 3-phosphoshikimate 1-carboxyvinyltransferase [Coraliomargaritaceae bacterium]
MTDPFPVHPICRPLDATVTLPGSKSITNRALILAALADQETTLKGALFSRDTRIMLQALDQLGFDCEQDPEKRIIRVTGKGGRIPAKSASIQVGNAGTAARFLTAFLALEAGGEYFLDGDPAMRIRPMSGLLDALVTIDAATFDFHGQAGHFPFTLKANGYRGGSCSVDASASSQILSALLLAAPAGNGSVAFSSPNVRPAYITITQKIRESFGASGIQVDPSKTYHLSPVNYTTPNGGSYQIEPDLSAASYFLALTVIHGGKLVLPGISQNPLQGDAQFADTLCQHGLQVQRKSDAWIAAQLDSRSSDGPDRAINFNTYSDTFLTYAAIAPLLGGSVRITGIAHTRLQETDRVAGMANELSKLGQSVEEEKDSLHIHPNIRAMKERAIAARKNGQLIEIETYEDHRFAMSFAVLGSHDLLGDGKPWLAIKDPACCGKTFPNFFEVLQSLHNV